MSKYEKLDRLICQSIKDGNLFFGDIFSGAVLEEAHRLHFEQFKIRKHEATHLPTFVDRRLQALRKQGFVVFNRKHGWILCKGMQ